MCTTTLGSYGSSVHTVLSPTDSFLIVARTAGIALNRIGRVGTVVLFLRLEENLSVFLFPLHYVPWSLILCGLHSVG